MGMLPQQAWVVRVHALGGSADVVLLQPVQQTLRYARNVPPAACCVSASNRCCDACRSPTDQQQALR